MSSIHKKSQKADPVEDEEPGRIPGPGPVDFEQKRLDALKNLMNRKTHEPVTEDMEIEGFDIHGVHPDQGAPIIQFGTAQRQDLNDDFAQLDRDINQLHNQEAKHGEMSERQQRLLEIMKSRNPEWDKYFNPDGTPKVMNFEQENDGKTSIERLKEKYEATKLGKSAKKAIFFDAHFQKDLHKFHFQLPQPRLRPLLRQELLRLLQVLQRSRVMWPLTQSQIWISPICTPPRPRPR